MPPRYAYWTIIIDDAPTAFRARDREDLLPTFRQLSRRNPKATMKWFSHGRLWESPEEAREARRPAPRLARHGREARGRDWRPGGAHKDPRARFKPKPGEKKKRRETGRRANEGSRAGRGAGHAGGKFDRYRKPWQQRAKQGTPDTNDTPGAPEPPEKQPPRPPGPDRPPKPGHEPAPEAPDPETIRILPEPPERARRSKG